MDCPFKVYNMYWSIYEDNIRALHKSPWYTKSEGSCSRMESNSQSVEASCWLSQFVGRLTPSSDYQELCSICIQALSTCHTSRAYSVYTNSYNKSSHHSIMTTSDCLYKDRLISRLSTSLVQRIHHCLDSFQIKVIATSFVTRTLYKRWPEVHFALCKSGAKALAVR